MDNVFTENPNLRQYFATSDGQPFYHKQDASNHAKTLEDKTVKLVERPAEKEDVPSKVVEPPVAEIAAQIDAVTSLEGLEQFKADTRKGVIKAVEKKTAELTKPTE